MATIAFVLKGSGVLLVLHAAYSCMHYRSLLQEMDLLNNDVSTSSASLDGEISFETPTTATSVPMIPPLDVYVELAIAFFFVLVSELFQMGPLQSVDIVGGGSKRKPLAAPAYRTRDFDIYTNRSKLLLLNTTNKAK